MRFLRRVLASQDKKSLSLALRQRRFRLFKKLVSGMRRPLRILDVGGTQEFWKMMGFTSEDGIQIVLFNLAESRTSYPNFESMVGDVRDMGQFGDKEFDIVFSNSMIEHLGSYEDQKKAAREIRRVGKRYFIQTPNYYFPIEPHFLFPFFQYLPLSLRVSLVRHFNMGWYKKIPDPQKAIEAVSRIRLLCRNELQELFPGATIHREKFLGLTKSFIACAGW